MKKELKSKVDLFLNNKKSVEKVFKYESEYNYLLSSYLYTDVNKEVNVDYLAKIKEEFKERKSSFINYNFLSTLLITKMSLQKQPLEYLEKINNNYKSLKGKRLFNSIYNVISSIIISDLNNKKIDKIVKKEKKIYELMKKNHPFLTDDEDVPFAMLLAINNKNEKELINDIECSFSELSKYFKLNKNEVYTMAQILSLSDKDTSEKVKKIINICELLKKNKKAISFSFGLPVLATLVFLDKDINVIVEDIVEVDNYLGSKKGTGSWYFGKSTRLLFAMLLVCSTYQSKDSKVNNVAVISSIIADDIISTLMIMNIIVLSD